MNDTAIIAGNGVSRLAFDLDELKENGPVFGCNAIFRDYLVDWLVAIDPEIIAEIKASSFPADRFIETPFDEQFEPAAFSPRRFRENAGMIAMKTAIKFGFKNLLCIGFDFVLEDQVANNSNVYDGTASYQSNTRANDTDMVNRAIYLDWFASKSPETSFLFVFPKQSVPYRFRTFQSSNIKGVIT